MAQDDAPTKYLKTEELRRRLTQSLPSVRSMDRNRLVHLLSTFESPLPAAVHDLTDGALRRRVKEHLPRPAQCSREQLLAECTRRCLVTPEEAAARRSRPDVAARRSSQFAADEVCRTMSLTRLLRGFNDAAKKKVIARVQDTADRLSEIVHQRSFLVFLHIRRLLDDGLPLPDLLDKDATFFRHCFTVGIGTTVDPAVSETLRAYAGHFWKLPDLPKSLGNSVSHAAKLYRTNFINHFTLLDNVEARVKRVASYHIHGIVVGDPDGDDDAAGGGERGACGGVHAVWEAIRDGTPVERRLEPALAAVREAIGLPATVKLTEAWLKKNIHKAIGFVLHVARLVDRIKGEADAVVAAGGRVRRGLGRGIKFCPTHRCMTHCAKLDATDLLRILEDCPDVVPKGTPDTAANVVRAVFRPALKEAFGSQLADDFTGTIDTDGVTVSIHFRRRLTRRQLSAKTQRVAAARAAREARERAAPGTKPPRKARVVKKLPQEAVPRVLLGVDVGRVNVVNITVLVDGKPFFVKGPTGADRRLKFRLTAAHLYTASGVRQRRRVMMRRRSALGIDQADRRLSRSTLRSSDVHDVLAHLDAFAASRNGYWAWARRRATRQDKLRSRAGRARVVARFFSRVRRTLKVHIPDISSKDVIVAWGNAKVAPSGRGNVTVPTHGTARAAALVFKRALRQADEYRTSQGCPDCHCKVHAARVVADGVNVRVRRARGSFMHDVRHGFLSCGTRTRRVLRRWPARALASRCTSVPSRTEASCRWTFDGHAGEDKHAKKEKALLRGPGCEVTYKRGLRFCPGCRKLRDRDDMASDNIATVWMWDNCCGGKRADFFCRQAIGRKTKKKDV